MSSASLCLKNRMSPGGTARLPATTTVSTLKISTAATATTSTRAGYTVRFCSTDTAWADVAAHPIPVYLVRGEPGTRGETYIDLRPR
jgi:hypothetical protein